MSNINLSKLTENLPPPSYSINNLWYSTGWQSAYDQYRRTDDWNAYIADCVYMTAKYMLDQYAVKNPSARYLAGSMSALQHAIRGAVEKEIQHLREPDVDGETHADYFADVWHRTWHHVDRHWDRFDVSLQRALRHIGQG